MRAVRFGSYSMCATFAGTPSLSLRRKSTTRYARLCPPPWCRVVIRPLEFRPPFLCSGRISDCSGWSRVISAKAATLDSRLPAVIGLWLRTAISDPKDFDRLALRRQRHDRALGVLAVAEAVAGAFTFPLAVDRVDAQHLHTEDLLDRDLDLSLVGIGANHERVLVILQQAVGLLGDHRLDQDVSRIRYRDSAHYRSLPSVPFAARATKAS